MEQLRESRHQSKTASTALTNLSNDSTTQLYVQLDLTSYPQYNSHISTPFHAITNSSISNSPHSQHSHVQLAYQPIPKAYHYHALSHPENVLTPGLPLYPPKSMSLNHSGALLLKKATCSLTSTKLTINFVRQNDFSVLLMRLIIICSSRPSQQTSYLPH